MTTKKYDHLYKMYKSKLIENQQLKKYIKELEQSIYQQDQKHWDYYKKMQAAIHHSTFGSPAQREFLFKHLDSWNKKSNV